MCGRCKSAMGPRRKRKRQRRRRKMKGGIGPFFVDWKKGVKLLSNKDMWKMSPSKAEKQLYTTRKRQYHASGTKDSYNTWMRKKGYVQKKKRAA